MRIESLRRIILRYPFRPVRLTLDDGTKVIIEHPELVMLGQAMCGVVRDPDFPLLFEPEKVLAAQRLRSVPRKSGPAPRR